MEAGWSEDQLLSIRERAYLYLKDMILEGELKTGDRLVERELAEKLKISRTPVREALFRLESQGFVKTVPRKGVVVTNISDKEIIEVFTILSSLEVLASKLAVQKMDESMKEQFNECIDRMEKALEEEETTPDALRAIHDDMNHLVYKAAKNAKLYDILISLTDYIRAFAKTGHRQSGRIKKAMEEHLAIMKAIANEESEMAEYLTKIHIENSKKAYIEAVDAMNNKQK